MIKWLVLLAFFAPMVLCWVLYVTGQIGESDGPLFKTWSTWTSVASLALFPICFWLAGDRPQDASGVDVKV